MSYGRRRQAIEKGLKEARLALLGRRARAGPVASFVSRVLKRLDADDVLNQRSWISLASRIVRQELGATGLSKAAPDLARALEETFRREAREPERETLTLEEFLEQLQQMKRPGPLKQLLILIPGLESIAHEVDEDEIKYAEANLQSMTRDERRHPEIVDDVRRKRIARGAGRPVAEVDSLLVQFAVARRFLEGTGRG